MKQIIKNICDKAKVNCIDVQASRIEDILVLHNTNSIPLPITKEWLSEEINNDEDYNVLLKNYQEISLYLSEMKISDIAWAIINERFVHANNFEACKKSMEFTFTLDNPAEHGWVNFIILCERNKEYNLAIKVADKAYDKFKIPKYAALLCYELAQFGNKDDLFEGIDKLLQFPISDFEELAIHYSNGTAWRLLESGEFLLAKKLLQKITTKHNNFHPLINLAHCFMMETNKEEALKYYRKAKELNPYILDDFDSDRESLSDWITNSELWKMVRKELE